MTPDIYEYEVTDLIYISTKTNIPPADKSIDGLLVSK